MTIAADAPPTHVLGPRVVTVGEDARSPAERLISLLAEQVRTSFDLLGIKIDRAFAGINKRLDGLDVDVVELKKRITTLEKSLPPRRARTKLKPTRRKR